MAIRCSSLLLGIMCLLSVQLAGADVAVGDDLNLPPSVGSVGDKQPVLKASAWTQYGPRQFMFFAIEKTWEEAESTCVQYDAHLASVHSENEDYFIKRLIYTQTGSDRPSWLGGYNSHMVPQRWYWTDESPFDFSLWTPGQPDGSGHCLQTNFKRGWDDLDCNSKIPFVCARRIMKGADRAVTSDAQFAPAPGTAATKQAVNTKSAWTSFGPRQFMFFAIEKTWEEAESTCVQYGGHLASVHSENEDYFIKRLIYTQTGSDRPSWLGGYNSHIVPQRWFWTDESTFDFSPWTPGQPDGSGHCLQTNFKRGWDDLDCNSKIPFVCARLIMKGAYGDVEIGAQLPPSLGADAAVRDDPNLSLPLSAVTFGGGTKLVVSFGSAGDNQPAVRASAWSSFGSRQFKFFTIQNTWEQAERTCKQYDAHLASVHNKNENNFIMSLIHTQAGGVWLGGYTDSDPSIWLWTDFSDFDHTNWSQGEPNGSRKCLQIYNNGLWDDFHCDRQLNFVCAR